MESWCSNSSLSAADPEVLVLIPDGASRPGSVEVKIDGRQARTKALRVPTSDLPKMVLVVFDNFEEAASGISGSADVWANVLDLVARRSHGTHVARLLISSRRELAEALAGTMGDPTLCQVLYYSGHGIKHDPPAAQVHKSYLLADPGTGKGSTLAKSVEHLRRQGFGTHDNPLADPDHRQEGFEDPGPPGPALAKLVERLRAGEGIAAVIGHPDMLAPELFAHKLGITRQCLNRWRQERKVLGVDGAKRGFRYPVWQIGDDGKIVRGITDVLASYPNNAWAAFRFLTQPLDQLAGRAPIDALKAGEVDHVAELAEAAARGDFF